MVGYGTTADADHITSGPEDGDGARRAMKGALRQAGLKPGDVQHLKCVLVEISGATMRLRVCCP